MGKHIDIRLTDEQRKELEHLIRAGNAPARTQTRARILLLTDRSQCQRRKDGEVAAALMCSKHTVSSIRRRFHEEGLHAALYDKPRPGPQPKFTGDIEAKLSMLACSDPPTGHAHWTLRLLADQMIELGYVEYVSHVTVGKLLKKTNLSPGA